MSLPATQMLPSSGRSSLVVKRMNVDFPDPDGPTRNTNSPFWMSMQTSRRATVVPLYDLVTWSNRIMRYRCAPRPCAQQEPSYPDRPAPSDHRCADNAGCSRPSTPPDRRCDRPWGVLVGVPAAVIFDFDGLILDTELPVFRAWSEAYERVGVAPLTVEEWSVQLGTHGKLDPLAELATRAAARDAPMDATALAVVAERRLQRRDELLSVETLRPGVQAWIDAAQQRGLAVAVASSSARPWVEGH